MSDLTRGGPPLNGAGRDPAKDPAPTVASKDTTTNDSKDNHRRPQVQTLLRHQNLSTTAIYTKVSDRRLAEGIERLDPFGPIPDVA